MYQSPFWYWLLVEEAENAFAIGVGLDGDGGLGVEKDFVFVFRGGLVSGVRVWDFSSVQCRNIERIQGSFGELENVFALSLIFTASQGDVLSEGLNIGRGGVQVRAVEANRGLALRAFQIEGILVVAVAEQGKVIEFLVGEGMENLQKFGIGGGVLSVEDLGFVIDEFLNVLQSSILCLKKGIRIAQAGLEILGAADRCRCLGRHRQLARILKLTVAARGFRGMLWNSTFRGVLALRADCAAGRSQICGYCE